MKKKLVAYFTAEGGATRRLAEALAEVAQAELFAIVPERPYTEADLDWRDKTSRSSVEMSDKTSRPAIAATVEDMERYDTLFVGFPIWWYVAPTVVNTFLESCNLAGVTVIPFATSGSSDMGGTHAALAPSCPGATLLEGRRFASPDKDELRAWVKDLGL